VKFHSRIRSYALASAMTAALAGLSCTASAAELPLIPAMPSTKAAPEPNAAIVYALKLRLPEGQGLARMLIQAGVTQADAAAAAKLAAGHLGDGQGGCDAKIEISRSLDGSSYTLARAVLLTASGQTTIERRAGELTVASQQRTTTAVRLV
jgi:hypothetical protein